MYALILAIFTYKEIPAIVITVTPKQVYIGYLDIFTETKWNCFPGIEKKIFKFTVDKKDKNVKIYSQVQQALGLWLVNAAWL